MGKKDLDQYAYFDDVLHFADVCNGILFQGVRRILPEELEGSDTQLIYPDKKMALSVPEKLFHMGGIVSSSFYQ